MKSYRPEFEQFRDDVEFGPADSCVWILYPPGCGGDLLASIVNFHYIETGARLRGIDSKGKVNFRPSDLNHLEVLLKQKRLKFDQQFFYDIADKISSNHLHWSKMDCLIFSGHCYQQHNIQLILSTFSNCKVIRFLPKTHGESSIINSMSRFKNTDIDHPDPVLMPDNAKEVIVYPTITDQRVLTVFFSDFVNATRFHSTYQLIQQHLELAGPMITYDFVKFWIDHQHPDIREHINRLATS